MKYTSIYFSPTATTKKVVNAIENEIFSEGKSYDVTLPEDRGKTYAIDSDSVLIVGAPVYAGRIPELFEDYLKALQVKNQKVILVVLYGNRAYEDALLEMKDIFENKNCTVIAAGAFIGEHSCTSKVSYLRPDKIDMDLVKEFSNRAIQNLSRSSSVSVSGNRPYRERKPSSPVGPTTNENCTQCKRCAKMCPVNAIQLSNCKIVDESQCIHCYRCVRECPEEAKYFDERMGKLVTWLEEKCGAIRMEPDFFL